MDVTGTLNAALVDRYVIERELGRGGMATVYLARDLRHDRHVALKVLDPELGAVLGVERFLSEIRVTANLQHPHLLPLFDSGAADGLLFYVMPFIDGESLRARLERERQLPVDEAVRLSLVILSALEYAHQRGVVHRDLKPENILLQQGEPVVADFGIALAVSNAGGARITQTGLSLGTPEYMSPEQATGDRVIDARSDVYSMGAVLYEMLVGEVPHAGATVQAVIAKVIMDTPRSVRVMRQTVPESVDTAVLKALAKVPADRWPSARAFADALKGTVSVGTIVRSGVFISLGRGVRHAVRSVAFWRGAAAVTAALAAVLAWRAFRPVEPSGELQLARQLTFDGNVVGAAISPDGGWLAYVTDDCFGKEFTCTNTLQVREVDGTQSIKLVTWPSVRREVRWSYDGSTVAFVGSPDSSAAALYLIPRLGGTPQRVNVSSTARAFAPDGKLVLASGLPGRQSLLWFDRNTLARTDSVALPAGVTLVGLDIAPDGRQIIGTTTVGVGPLILLDARGKLLDSSSALEVRPIVRWDAGQRGVFVATPAPGTGDNIRYVPVRDGKLRADRARVALGMVQDGADGLMDVARTGRVVVVAGPTHDQVLAVKLGERDATWRSVAEHTSWVWGNAISPDGAFIAGSATDNVGENVDLFPLAGGAPRRVTSQRGIRDFPYWSANGRQLAYEAFTPVAALIGVMTTDADGGRERRIPNAGDHGWLIGWVGNDALVFLDGRTLTVLDTAGAVRRTVTVPDSLAPTSVLSGDAATRRVVWWSDPAGAIVVADLSSGRVTPLVRTAAVTPVGWSSDGSLFAMGVAGGGTMAAGTHQDRVLEKLVPGHTTFVTVATLPSGCWVVPVGGSASAGVAIGADGTVASCTVRRYAPDVWLADVGGKSGW
jgi:serine/threonine-protein kinase